MQKQQQQQLSQTAPEETWENMIADRLRDKNFDEDDAFLESIAPEQLVPFLLQLQQQDRPAIRRYTAYFLSINITIFIILIYLSGLLITKFISKDFFNHGGMLRFILSQILIILSSYISTLTLNKLAPKSIKHINTRKKNTTSLLSKTIPLCSTPEIIPILTGRRKSFSKELLQKVDSTLVRILTRMSGEAVFALPFETRAELARIAEDTETDVELAVVILLALSSARDGNVQPVLRRLVRDARSPRLREVAAECQREFSWE